MNICCENPEQLGCINSCNTLTLGIAVFDGDYTLLLSSGYEVTQTFSIGDVLEFAVALNEDMFYKARLTHPNATYTCFEFKTYFAV